MKNLLLLRDYDLHNRLVEKGYKLGFIEPEEIHLGEPKVFLKFIKSIIIMVNLSINT